MPDAETARKFCVEIWSKEVQRNITQLSGGENLKAEWKGE